MKVTYLTREGYEKLKQELEYLKSVKRLEVARALEEARAKGDLSENAEYDAAKQERELVEARIAELERKLAFVRIIDDENIPDDKVYIGATVYLEDLDKGEELYYTLVSPEEADFKQRKISTTSPVGKALLGKGVGDEVEIQVPAGVLRYRIVKIERG